MISINCTVQLAELHVDREHVSTAAIRVRIILTGTHTSLGMQIFRGVLSNYSANLRIRFRRGARGLITCAARRWYRTVCKKDRWWCTNGDGAAQKAQYLWIENVCLIWFHLGLPCGGPPFCSVPRHVLSGVLEKLKSLLFETIVFYVQCASARSAGCWSCEVLLFWA